MNVKCSKCGIVVSNAIVPEQTIIRAYVECPECIEKEIDWETKCQKESFRSNILLTALECIAEGDCYCGENCPENSRWSKYRCDSCRAKKAILEFHERGK